MSGVVIGAGIPLMYSNGLLGLAYAFAIAEAVGLVARGIVMARFFHGVRILRHLLRAFAPTVFASVPILALRVLTGPEPGAAAALAVFSLYIALTVLATLLLERPLLAEAIGYVRRRQRPTSAVAGTA
jgi:hypothetical protein